MTYNHKGTLTETDKWQAIAVGEIADLSKSFT